MSSDSIGEVLPPAGVPDRSWRCAMLAAALLGAIPSAAHAADLTVAVGQSNHSNPVLRLGAQFNFSQRWFESGTGHLSGYWDAGYTYWDGKSGARNHSISLNPVFVYEFNGDRFRPYVEAGIGVAFFAHTRMHGYNLSTSFQFEDRLGLGVRFDGHELGLRAQHYSNANIKRPNDGAETYTIHYRRSF